MGGRTSTLIGALIIAVTFLVIAWLYIQQNQIPRTEQTVLPEYMADQQNVVSDKGEVQVTRGIKHSVPLEEIVGGGPPRDGIPSIDNPQFISVGDADQLLAEGEPGIALSLDGVNRFYPFQILVWHEIVNDTINGQRILVTYCPLCFSGIVFDPVVQGVRVEFGTSGKLWNSNLVMYDRRTESYWSQVLGEAIVGEMTGAQLKVLPSDQITYGDWKALHPDGDVLSRETGISRSYGVNPYGNYFSNNEVFFPTSNQDDRLENKDFVLGIVIDGQARAYFPPAIKDIGRLEETFAGKNLVIEWNEDIEAVRMFEKLPDGTSERVNPFANFWFSWAAVHPDTELFK
jgi:hypothetical protein